VIESLSKVWIVLPVFNEAEALPALIADISRGMEGHDLMYRILVVDDGSSDSTPEVLRVLAEEYPLEIIKHSMNRGLGETIRDGFEAAADRCRPDDVIVRLDADGTHEPGYIPHLVSRIEEGFDIVIASRFRRGGGQIGVSRYRALISRCANLVLKVFFPIRGVWEYTCGFRAYRASLIQDAILVFGNYFIDLKGLGFTCTAEKLIKLRMLTRSISEVPFVLRYDWKQGPSKMLSGVTTLGYLVLILKNIRPWGRIAKQWREDIRRMHRQAVDG